MSGFLKTRPRKKLRPRTSAALGIPTFNTWMDQVDADYVIQNLVPQAHGGLAFCVCVCVWEYVVYGLCNMRLILGSASW